MPGFRRLRLPFALLTEAARNGLRQPSSRSACFHASDCSPEPVYLSDESIEQQPRFHRYVIGARKLPDLRNLRAAFLGRAIHSSLEAWGAQVGAVAG